MRKRDRHPTTGWLAEEIIIANSAVVRLQNTYHVVSADALAECIRTRRIVSRRVQRDLRLWRGIEAYRQVLREALSVRPHALPDCPPQGGDANLG